MNPLLPLLDLSGRTALVTGSSRGIGEAIARALAGAGASVLVHGGPDHRAEADAVAATLPGARALALDLSAPGSGRALADAAGPVDILVLNASIEIRAPWDEATPAATALQLSANLAEQLALVQALVPGMTGRGWGRVLGLGSVQTARGHPQMMVYAATKAALVSMVRTLARQVAAQGVTANVLSPGAIETARNAEALSDLAYRAAVLAAIPAGRLGRVEDCAPLALFLCSDAAAYVTGAELRVDGGMSL